MNEEPGPVSTRSANICLALPSVDFHISFFAAMREFESEGIPQIPPNVTEDQFPVYVQTLHDQSVGKNLKEGYVPSKEYWIVDSNGYAGRIILGLTYYPSPERLGNHVGYAVRPTKRGNGYATHALRLLLDEARNLQIYRLMPTCSTENLASRKVIERNGGVLINPLPNDVSNDRELRFLIDLKSRIDSHGR